MPRGGDSGGFVGGEPKPGGADPANLLRGFLANTTVSATFSVAGLYIANKTAPLNRNRDVGAAVIATPSLKRFEGSVLGHVLTFCCPLLLSVLVVLRIIEADGDAVKIPSALKLVIEDSLNVLAKDTGRIGSIAGDLNVMLETLQSLD